MSTAPLPYRVPRCSSEPGHRRGGPRWRSLVPPVPVPPNVPQPTGNHGIQRGTGQQRNRLNTNGKGVRQGPQIGRRYVFQTDCAGSIPVARSAQDAYTATLQSSLHSPRRDGSGYEDAYEIAARRTFIAALGARSAP
jgi:hypothetical protein